MWFSKLNPFPKFIIIFLFIGGLAYLLFGVLNLQDKIAPKGTRSVELDAETEDLLDEGTELARMGVVTWGGNAGGQYFNNGFLPSKNSRYFKEKGILVDFVLLEDFEASRAAWKADEVQFMWVTADAYCTESDALKDYEPIFVFQTDWSRGGDAIVVNHNITSVSDLRGKKIAVALGTPSHSFILLTLEAGNVSYSDVEIVGVASAIDAASLFKSGAVDAAVVWSPDDLDCTRSVPGSRILKSTKEASYVIADGFFVKKSYLEKHRNVVKAVAEGFFQGAAEINTNSQAREKAIQILMAGLNLDRALAENMLNNVRLATYGDNVNFLNVNGNYTGVTGEKLYTKMSRMYSDIGFINSTPPMWRNVSTASVIQSINLSGPEHSAEGQQKFQAPTKEDLNAPVFSAKELTVSFPTGSAELDENAKTIIDLGFGQTAQFFASSRVMIEGNTDNVGNRQSNISLSYRRAEAVANYLVSKYSFDRNRFIIKGNGPDNPTASNDSPEGRSKNRRTDFKILN